MPNVCKYTTPLQAIPRLAIKTRNVPTEAGSGVNSFQKNKTLCGCFTSSGTWPGWRHRSFAGWFRPGTFASRFVPGPRGRCWPDGSANGAADLAAAGGPAAAAAAGNLPTGVDLSHRNCSAEATG